VLHLDIINDTVTRIVSNIVEDIVDTDITYWGTSMTAYWSESMLSYWDTSMNTEV